MTNYKYCLIMLSVCVRCALASTEYSLEISLVLLMFTFSSYYKIFQITKNILISECIIIRTYYIPKLILLRSNLIKFTRFYIQEIKIKSEQILTEAMIKFLSLRQYAHSFYWQGRLSSCKSHGIALCVMFGCITH